VLRGNGKELFYVVPERKLMTVALDTAGGTFQASVARIGAQDRLAAIVTVAVFFPRIPPVHP
jgi:hypothetical protein